MKELCIKRHQIDHFFKKTLVHSIKLVYLVAVYIQYCNYFPIPDHWYYDLRF